MQAVGLAKLDERRDAAPDGIGALLKTVGMTLVSTVGGAAGPLYGTCSCAWEPRRRAAPSSPPRRLGGRPRGRRRGRAGARQARGRQDDAGRAAAGVRGAERGRRPRPSGPETPSSGRPRRPRSGMKATDPARRPQGPRQLPRGAQRRASGPGRHVLVALAPRGGDWLRRGAATCGRRGHGPERARRRRRDRARGRPRPRQPQRPPRGGRPAELAAQMAGAEPAHRRGRRPRPARQAARHRRRLVARAIDEVWSDDGVLVLMDLGSAVLSAEIALELLADERRDRVLLTEAPFVEGAVAAAVAAAVGAGLEARRGGGARRAGRQGRAPGGRRPRPAGRRHRAPSGATGPAAPAPPRRSRRAAASDRDPLGLHARPAAALVRTAAALRRRVTVTDVTSGRGPVSAAQPQRAWPRWACCAGATRSWCGPQGRRRTRRWPAVRRLAERAVR